MNKLFFGLLFSQILVSITLQAAEYKKCIKDEMKQRLSTLNCDFSKLTTARVGATNKCGPVLLKDLTAILNLKIGSEEFKSSIDNQKREANADLDDLSKQEAKRCGVSLYEEGDSVTTFSPAAK